MARFTVFFCFVIVLGATLVTKTMQEAEANLAPAYAERTERLNSLIHK